jgi:hypothetical protein
MRNVGFSGMTELPADDDNGRIPVRQCVACVYWKGNSNSPTTYFAIPLADNGVYAKNWRFLGPFDTQRLREFKITSTQATETYGHNHHA